MQDQCNLPGNTPRAEGEEDDHASHADDAEVLVDCDEAGVEGRRGQRDEREREQDVGRKHAGPRRTAPPGDER